MTRNKDIEIQWWEKCAKNEDIENRRFTVAFDYGTIYSSDALANTRPVENMILKSPEQEIEYENSSESNKHVAQSFTARRPTSSNLPEIQLPQPDHRSALHNHSLDTPKVSTQPSAAVVNNIPSPQDSSFSVISAHSMETVDVDGDSHDTFRTASSEYNLRYEARCYNDGTIKTPGHKNPSLGVDNSPESPGISQQESLDPTYQVRDIKDHFKVGRIFKVLWSEPRHTSPKESTIDRCDKGQVISWNREKVCTSIRRFVVIRGSHCVCLPISTYTGSRLHRLISTGTNSSRQALHRHLGRRKGRHQIFQHESDPKFHNRHTELPDFKPLTTISDAYMCEDCQIYQSAYTIQRKDHLIEQIHHCKAGEMGVGEHKQAHESHCELCKRNIYDPKTQTTFSYRKSIAENLDSGCSTYRAIDIAESNKSMLIHCFYKGARICDIGPELRYHDDIPPFVLDTVESRPSWILNCEEFKMWRDQDGGCLWISGGFGTGKTTAVSTISRHFELGRRKGQYIVSYFSDIDVRGINASIAILTKIIIKLLVQGVTEKSEDTLQNQLEELVRAGEHISAIKMRSIESRIRHLLGKDMELCIFIDALDECEEDQDQEVLFELIERLSRSDVDHHIKCVVSCPSSLFRKRRTAFKTRLDLDSRAENKWELMQYVRHALEKGGSLYTDHDVQILVYEIFAKASGMFLWARTIVDDILSPDFPLESSRLERTIPPLELMNITTLHEKLLNRITDYDQNTAISLLRWVTYAAKPLHVNELCGAIFAEAGIVVDKTTIVKTCGGLLSIDKNNTVRLLHFSVRNYLQTRMKQNWKELSANAHEAIAHACLKTLSPEKFLQSLNLSQQTCKKMDRLGNPTVEYHCFENYAHSNWIYHYRLAEFSSCFLAGLLHTVLESSLKMANKAESHCKDPASFALPILNEQIPSLTSESRATCPELDSFTIGLLIAARFGLPKLAKLELEMGAELDVVCGSEGLTPLICASMAGHVEVVRQLLQYDAIGECTTSPGKDAMAHAIANGHDEMVGILLNEEQNSRDFGMDQESSPSYETTSMISMGVSFLPICGTCNAVEVVYEFRQMPCLSYHELAHEFNPIIVQGEIIARVDVEAAALESVQSRAILKWFPEAAMYNALTVAATGGIETMMKLFAAVGNDVGTLMKEISLSALTSRLSI